MKSRHRHPAEAIPVSVTAVIVSDRDVLTVLFSKLSQRAYMLAEPHYLNAAKMVLVTRFVLMFKGLMH